MTFYLQPPSGNVPYHKLEEFGLNRLRFLARLVACKDNEERQEALLDADTVNWSQCLIAGSVKDKISHYILRLALANDLEAGRFLCDAETIFFRMRLESFSTHEWISFFKLLRKCLSRHQEIEELTELRVLLNALTNSDSESWLSLVEGIKNPGDESKCIHLPFQLVMRFVAVRRVVLNMGYAAVPFCLIPDVLEELFSRLMTNTIRQTSQSQRQRQCQADSRMARLSAVLKRAYHSEADPTAGIPLRSKALTLDTMNSSQIYFPQCMSQLMTTLRKHHRLCHRDRIQLTLFLKELGLPLHQALLFWKREYSKPAVLRGDIRCGHDWQGNERRYIYSIRHLYGLEGRRVSYTAHSCAAVQGRQLTCVDYGGCPFTSLEPSALSGHLTQQGLVETDIEDILHRVKDGCVEKACRLTMTYRVMKKAVATDDLNSKCFNLNSSIGGKNRNGCCSRNQNKLERLISREFFSHNSDAANTAAAATDDDDDDDTIPSFNIVSQCVERDHNSSNSLNAIHRSGNQTLLNADSEGVCEEVSHSVDHVTLSTDHFLDDSNSSHGEILTYNVNCSYLDNNHHKYKRKMECCKAVNNIDSGSSKEMRCCVVKNDRPKTKTDLKRARYQIDGCSNGSKIDKIGIDLQRVQKYSRRFQSRNNMEKKVCCDCDDENISILERQDKEVINCCVKNTIDSRLIAYKETRCIYSDAENENDQVTNRSGYIKMEHAYPSVISLSNIHRDERVNNNHISVMNTPESDGTCSSKMCSSSSSSSSSNSNESCKNCVRFIRFANNMKGQRRKPSSFYWDLKSLEDS